jgi:tetratricopeptide (TPR) repeat protein
VSLLLELAGLFERELGDFARAAQALRRAFEADPSDHGLLDEIERVATLAGNFEVLSGLIETATRGDVSRADKRDLWMRGFTWYRARLSDPARAEQALRRALDMDPEYEPAHEQLVQLLRELQRHRELVEALIAWAERESDRSQAVLRLGEAAAIAETGAGDREGAIACYERVLALDGEALSALDELIRLQESEGRLGKVAQLYDRRIEAEADPSVRQMLRHRAASLRAEQLGDREGAIRLHLANLDDEPSDAVSLDALERFYREGEQWQELLRLLERRLEVATTSDQRSSARVGLALLAEQQLKDRGRAIDELREVLLESPDHAQAQTELLRLLEAEQRFPELVEALERRAELCRDRGDEAGELASLLRLGEVTEGKLGDRARAAEVYERALERAPRHPAVLGAVVRLSLDAGDFARAGDVLERLLECVSGAELVDAAYRLAELADTKLDAPGRAEAALRRALEAGEREPETRERLAKLYERRGNHAALAQLVAEEAERSVDVTQKVALLRRVSELYRTKLADPASAASFLERASQLVPDDRAVLVPLCELYIAAGRQKDAVPVLEKIVASFGGRRVKELASFHHMLARAYQGMGELERAVAELDAAYRVDLTNVGVLADLGLLAYTRGDLDRAQKTFRGLLLQKLDKDAPISKADVYFYLGDISRQQGDAPKAISMLERAVAEQASHERARALLTSLKAGA